MKCVYSPDAQSDLEAIWDCTAEDWGGDQAEAYARLLQNASEVIAANPLVGRDCSDIRSGYRKYPVGSQMMFYRIGDDSRYIVRILHQRMDYGRHL
jgi:toxin ParE1/3/4